MIRIVSLWHAGCLRNIDTVCIASWLRLGFEVELFHFGPVSGVPDGVRLADGRDVLSDSYLERLVPIYRVDRRKFQPVANFSDLFRIKLMEQGRGLWLDTDVFLFRTFDVDPQRPFFAWEDRHRIGSPVFYLPPDSAMLQDYLKVFDDPRLMPHWLGLVRGVLRPAFWRMIGRTYSPPDLGITIYGNDAFTRLAKKHGLTGYALPRRSFYPWGGRDTERFFTRPEYGRLLWDDPGVFGLHIHRKRLSNVAPLPGTMYAHAVEQLADGLPRLTWEPR